MTHSLASASQRWLVPLMRDVFGSLLVPVVCLVGLLSCSPEPTGRSSAPLPASKETPQAELISAMMVSLHDDGGIMAMLTGIDKSHTLYADARVVLNDGAEHYAWIGG